MDALTFIRLYFKPVATVAAENLFFRKQLGLYVERKTRARRVTDGIRFTLAQLSHYIQIFELFEIIGGNRLSFA